MATSTHACGDRTKSSTRMRLASTTSATLLLQRFANSIAFTCLPAYSTFSVKLGHHAEKMTAEQEIPKKKKKITSGQKSSEAQCITERSILPKMWHPDDSDSSFKIISWNVNGLRALMRKYPTALSELAEIEKPDAICLQETKLQEMHLDDKKLKLTEILKEEGGF